MATIKLSRGNVEVTVPAMLASKELSKAAGLMDFLTGGLIPEDDFKKLWAKEQIPGGAFSNRIVALKEAAEAGRLDAKLLIQGLEALARAGSVKAQALLPRYKMVLESWARGNKAAAQEAQTIISQLTNEFQKLVKTKPPNYTGTRMDKSRSQYTV